MKLPVDIYIECGTTKPFYVVAPATARIARLDWDSGNLASLDHLVVESFKVGNNEQIPHALSILSFKLPTLAEFIQAFPAHHERSRPFLVRPGIGLELSLRNLSAERLSCRLLFNGEEVGSS